MIAEDVGYEYLDDGGVMACRLSGGPLWTFGSPAGGMWRALVEETSLDDVCMRVAQLLGATPDEVLPGVRAFCQVLEERGLLAA